jgi:hypothetical protein
MPSSPTPTPRSHARRPARPSRGAVALLLVLFLAAAVPGRAEALAYRWSLRGLAGRVAGLVLPGHGRGELRTEQRNGGYVTELEITSPESKRGEYFLYGSETRPDGTTTVAWSSYRWRDKEKSKRENVRAEDVVDVAAGIRMIREQQPQGSMGMRIWSDGKTYPVTVQRVGTESVEVPAGTFVADHYRVRGQRITGQRFWKGGLDLWVAQDEARTPVRIQVERGFANVRLDLLPAGS